MPIVLFEFDKAKQTWLLDSRFQPHACFLQEPHAKFSLYGNLHHMDFQIFTL